MTEPAVVIAGLGFAYEPGSWILRHLSAELPRGSVTALLGPNGRGKTTLLKLLLGILTPSEGSLRLGGPTAFVPQLFRTAFAYTVLDMVLMGRAQKIGLWSQPSADDEAAALAALDRFGLADLAGRPFDQISGGQRQLAILARAIVSEAEIIILDEPCAALDLRNQALVLEWIGRLADVHGLTVLFSTHTPQHASAMADRVMLMFGAEDCLVGPPDEVLNETNLERLYGVPVRRTRDESGANAGFLPVFPARER